MVGCVNISSAEAVQHLSMRRYRTGYADWTMREYGAILRCLLTGKVHQGPDTEELARLLGVLYQPSFVFPLNYAHHGIGLALSWFKRQKPDCDEVIVPAYICPSVPQTVRAAGLKVRCVPVGDDLNLTAEGVGGAIGSATLAVIAPHMYGCPAPIEALEALCRDAGVFLIDDAAQVVAERVAGRLLGTFGDVGVISFAQSKAIVTGIRGSGGVLLVNRPEWHEQAILMFATLPAASARLGPLADFLWNYLGLAYTGQSGYYVTRLLAKLPLGSLVQDRPTRISNLEAAVAIEQLLRIKAMRTDRIRLLQSYADALSDIEGISFSQYEPNRFLARVVVRLEPGLNADQIRKRLALHGVDSRTGYPPVAEDHNDETMGLAWRELLIGLPVSAKLRDSDVRVIGSVLRDALLAERQTSAFKAEQQFPAPDL